MCCLKYFLVAFMIKNFSEVCSYFRIFIWILAFISPCLEISFFFLNRKKYLDSFYKQGGDFLFSERKKILIFSVDQLTAISSLWWTKDWNFFKNSLTVFSLLMQNRISTKINFLDSGNKNLGIITSYSFCLSIVFLWTWQMTLSKHLVKKSVKKYFSVMVSFSWSKLILIC